MSSQSIHVTSNQKDVTGASLNNAISQPPIQPRFILASELRHLDTATRSRLFAVVRYAPAAATDSAGGLQIDVPLRQLNEESLAEIWLSPEPVEVAAQDNLRYSMNDSVLFGSVTLGDEDDLRAATYNAYKQITRLLQQQNFSSMLRTWNYFPDINQESGQIERYRQFCLGRQQAYDEYGQLGGSNYPAATVIGSHREIGNTGEIYFIAAREDGVAHENPRQTSAYHYPEQYGPVSPAFSRSMRKQWQNQAVTFISGTASIVGYESRHPNDCLKQTEEILANLSALIQSVEADTPGEGSLKNLSQLKVYLRNTGDYENVKDRIDAALGPGHDVIYLHGDICRTDLLIEMEGITHAGMPPG